MKSIISIILLSLSFQFSTIKDTSKKVDIEAQILTSKIYIFDYNGILLKSLNKADVQNEEISLLDLEMLETSDFAYTFNEDEYRFR